jgi:hypothetical protein
MLFPLRKRIVIHNINVNTEKFRGCKNRRKERKEKAKDWPTCRFWGTSEVQIPEGENHESAMFCFSLMQSMHFLPSL